MTNITYKGDIVYFAQENIAFSENISQIKQDDDIVFILLDIPPKQELTYDDYHNVYCYSSNGEKIWQIGARPNGDKAVYTMINTDDTHLYANDFMGRRYTVDKRSGLIRDIKITK